MKRQQKTRGKASLNEYSTCFNNSSKLTDLIMKSSCVERSFCPTLTHNHSIPNTQRLILNIKIKIIKYNYTL